MTVVNKDGETNTCDILYRNNLQRFSRRLPLSLQFHHTQMDGLHAGRFLRLLQEAVKDC